MPPLVSPGQQRLSVPRPLPTLLFDHREFLREVADIAFFKGARGLGREVGVERRLFVAEAERVTDRDVRRRFQTFHRARAGGECTADEHRDKQAAGHQPLRVPRVDTPSHSWLTSSILLCTCGPCPQALPPQWIYPSDLWRPATLLAAAGRGKKILRGYIEVKPARRRADDAEVDRASPRPRGRQARGRLQRGERPPDSARRDAPSGAHGARGCNVSFQRVFLVRFVDQLARASCNP